MEEYETVFRVLVRRALTGDDPAHLQAHFAVAVLEHYRDLDGVTIVRTDTVGRVKKQGSWTLDFGIAPAEDVVHTSVGELMRLPVAEREHWALHALALPSSKMFLQMRLAPGSCFDDGELRAWS